MPREGRGRRGGVAAIGLLAAALWAAGSAALPAAEPEVEGILETREPGSDLPLLQVTGRNLRRVHDARLEFPDGTPGPVLGVISPGSTSVKLSIEEPVVPGEYDLVLVHGTEKAPAELRFRVSVSGGLPLPGSVLDVAVAPELREELDDADLLAGEGKEFHQDASHYESGMLPMERFSAAEDLADEGHIAGGRFVTGLYSAWEDLEAEGAAADGMLLSDRFEAWEDLLEEGHRDGDGDLHTDHFSAWEDLLDEGFAGGSGLLGTARFSAWESLRSQGWVDSSGHLGSLLFSAYDDLVAEGKVGPGAFQVAAGNHGHANRYLESSGTFTLGGPLTIDVTAGSAPTAPLLWGTSSAAGTAGVKVLLDPTTVTGPLGVPVGRGPGSVGILAEQTATTGVVHGIRVVNESPYGFTVGGSFGRIVGILGSSASPDGTGFFVRTAGLAIQAIGEEHVQETDKGRARIGVHAVHGGTSGDIAVFQAGTTTQARIDRTGRGLFNGGTATSGADFAESVKASREVRLPEAGDVVVVDREATRGFALCTERCSRRVAGVVSTNPGVLAAPREVASGTAPPDEIPLAIVGIVPVKVCDEGGSIRPGDLLVSSSVPGLAMRAPPDPEPGTVVGKSLGRLGEGRGSVETLLMVQ